MIDTYYTKMKHITNALSDIENITSRFEEEYNTTYMKICFVVDNLTLAGFSSEDILELSRDIMKAVKKELLKTERILLDGLEGELDSVKDSLTAEEEYQNGKE